MHNLKPVTPLAHDGPIVATIGSVTISENVTFALASLAVRNGKKKPFEAAAKKHFKTSLPAVEKISTKNNWEITWIGQDQYFVAAPVDTHEDIAADLIRAFKDSASITEQTGGWVRFELEGDDCVLVLERLCAADTIMMKNGDTRRTVIEHMGVFILCRKPKTHFTIYGASSSAGSLHHALTTATRSI